MLINKSVLRAASTTSVAIVLLTVQPLGAQTSSDAERLQKLEKAVEQLQTRNAELEQEVESLKKEVISLRREREEVRNRVEKMLRQIEAISDETAAAV